jgi:regulation of enolase protein 1 (concanavalin A-like superfamily)
MDIEANGTLVIKIRPQDIITAYEDLRDKCVFIFKNSDISEGHWLRFAIGYSDIRHMESTEEGIVCSGFTYTMQTMDNEEFEFTIPHKYFERKEFGG